MTVLHEMGFTDKSPFHQVQKAQAEELQLAQSLQGAASDLDIVSQLETDFAGGIKQNQQNAQDVSAPLFS